MSNFLQDKIPLAVVITLIVAIFGWQFYRLERMDERLLENRTFIYQNQQQISERLGKMDIKLGNMETSLGLFKEMLDDYKRINGKPMNLEMLMRILANYK